VEEVRYYDEKINEMPMEREPSAVYNVNDEYAILVFGYNEGYLVRKSDGTAVFSLKDAGIPTANNVYVENRKSIFTDSGNNIYYRTDKNGNSSVIKINMQNPSNIITTTYSPQTDRVTGFVIDENGNMIYFGRNNSNVEISRIKKFNGGLKNLESQDGRFAWVGHDMNFYYFYADVIKKYVVATDTITDFGLKIDKWGGFGGGGYILTTNSRIIAISLLQNCICEVYPDPKIIQGYVGIPELGLDSIQYAASSANYYYIAGNDTSSNPVLLKVSAAADTPVTLLSGYDVYKFTVTPDDVVTFNALRMSDGAIIIGEISASGRVAVLDETINAEVTVLERIR
jgi:hypothetical protein